MKKPTLYREASYIAESMLSNMEYSVKCLEECSEKDESDMARLACYKVLQDYFENMEFLKSVKF